MSGVFGGRLKQLREEAQLTQLDLANKLSLVPSTVSQYESNRRAPDTNTVQRIADLFQVTTDYLLGRSDFRSRLPANITPVDINKLVKIPVIGRIQAGEPILCVENIIDYEYVQEESVKNGEYFYLKVAGDSMVGARIHEGDLVLVRGQSDVDNGEIAVVLVDEENATLKRVYKSNGHLILQSENPKYSPRIITSGDVKIIGKIVEVKFKL